MGWARVAVIPVLAGFLALLMPVPAMAVTPGYPPPTSGSEVVAVSSLPECPGNLSGTDEQKLKGAGLGWSGNWRTRFDASGSRVYDLVDFLPCLVGGKLSLTQGRTLVVGSPGAASGTGVKRSAAATCRNSDGTLFSVVFAPTLQLIGGGGSAGPFYMGAPITFAPHATYGDCLELVTITATRQLGILGSTSTFYPGTNSIWRAVDWKGASSGYKQATSESDIPGLEGVELPIVCDISSAGDDLFQIVGSVIGSMVSWPGCMLIPKGWDRAGLIAKAWNDSPAQTISGALVSALPSTLACGQVASIPFYSQTMSLNTCNVTFVPSWVKVVVTWFVVLSCGVAIWFRLAWSVGGS